MPILSSTNPTNIRTTTKADEMDLSREEWYQLLRAARGQPLP